jgi:ribosomal protein S18 acetylase RimI-like enzyme
VKPAFRGRSLAKGLLQNLQDIAPSLGMRKFSLQVTATQPAAIRLYEKMGFIKIGLLRENLLKDSGYLDEFLMEWHVKSR